MVSRFRGGVAKETFLLKIRTPADVEVAEFHEGDRSGNSNGASWTDLTLNDYIWEWETGRPSTLRFDIDDPGRNFFDDVKRGYKARLALDNPMKGCVLSFDMETIDTAENVIDLSLSGNDGVITGATDTPGFWGRSLLFDADTERLRTVSLTYDGFTAFGHGATVRIGNAFAGDTEQTIIGMGGASTNQQGTTVLLGPAAGLPDTIRVKINTSTTGFQNIDRSFAFVLGETYHIFVTWDGSAVRIYVDGVQQGAATTQTGTIVNQTAGLDFTVGHHADAAIHIQTFNERIDEAFVYKDRAPDSAEVAEIYKRRGRAPRFYFDGRVRKKQHRDGMTTFTCADNLVEAVDQEIYDLIFEGMETDDTVKPSFVYRTESSLKPSDAEHNQVHSRLLDVDGVDLVPADRVYEPIKLEYSTFGHWQRTGAAFTIGIFHITTTDRFFLWNEFDAPGSKIDKIWINAQFTTAASPVSDDFDIQIVSGDDPTVVIATKTFNSGSLADNLLWHGFDFTDVSMELVPDKKYFVGIVPAVGTAWGQGITPKIRWDRDSRIRRKAWTDSNDIRTLQEGEFQYHYILQFKDAWEELPDDEYEIKDGSGGNFKVIDLSNMLSIPPLPTTDPPPFSGFFRTTYFYAKNNKKVSDVIDRLLVNVNMTAIYTNTGALSSNATNENLGLYVPQGGTVLEHTTQLASLTNDRLKFIAPNFIQFQRWPEPGFVRNGSFERVKQGTTTTLADWDRTNDIFFDPVVRDSTQQFSGDTSAKFFVASGTGFFFNSSLFQDIESFDPAISGTDGNNFEIYDLSTTGFGGELRYKIIISDYGSNDNPITVLTVTAPTTSFTKRVFKIERSSFRLTIKFESSAILTADRDLFIDDIIPHPENQRSFFLVDAKEKDADYTSGFLPGTRTDDTIGVHLLDDYRSGPKIIRETSRRMINNAVVFGRELTFGIQEPILAIARNPGRGVQHGDRLRISRQESLASIDDAYLRAKKQIRFDATFRTSLDMVGQYPFLNGRVMRLFFPQDGLDAATAMEVTDITVDSKRTLVRFNRSITEQFEDVEKLQEKISQLSAAFGVDLSMSLFYFTTVDLPTTVDPNVIVKARLLSEDPSPRRSNYVDLIQRDTRDGTEPSVWNWSVGKKNGVTFNTTDQKVWTRFEIADSTGVDGDPTTGVLATITFDQEFAKLENQWIAVWIFAQ